MLEWLQVIVRGCEGKGTRIILKLYVQQNLLFSELLVIYMIKVL